MTITTKFGQVFNIPDERFKELERPGRNPVMELTADIDALKVLRTEMLADGLMLDGRLMGVGTLGMVFKAAYAKDETVIPQDIPEGVVRIENIAPLEHPIVLSSAFHKQYTGEYEVCIVPNAPDIEGMPVTFEDIKRSIQVLMADEKAVHLWDFEPDNFVFLKDPAGNIIRYPDGDDIPEDFRNKPIAFIRDLNAIPKDVDTSEEAAGILRAARELKDKLGIDIKDLPAAPRECVEACKQQYARTAQLSETLKRAGLVPDSIPIGPWTADAAQRTGWTAGAA